MADQPHIEPLPLPRLRHGARLFLFYTPAVLLTGLVSLLFADLLWRTGWSASRTMLLVLFIILFLLAAIGCMHGVFGFFIRILGTRCRVTGLKPYHDQDIAGTSTAIIFPIFNEDSVRVLEGLRATYESLQRTGRLDQFDFFILSDSTNPDRWIEETDRKLLFGAARTQRCAGDRIASGEGCRGLFLGGGQAGRPGQAGGRCPALRRRAAGAGGGAGADSAA